MQRYFAHLDNDRVVLEEDDVFHLTRVMRAKVGDELEIVDSKQTLYLSVIKSLKPLEIKIIEQLIRPTEVLNQISLYYVMAKGDKTDLVVQKATELGVHHIILLHSKRSVVVVDSSKIVSKVERYLKIAKEASEQSKRLIIPSIRIATKFEAIKEDQSNLKLIADEAVAGQTDALYQELHQLKNGSIAVLVGPEGGFAREEVELARQSGFKTISLGKRILRSETAAIHLCGLISSYLEQV